MKIAVFGRSFRASTADIIKELFVKLQAENVEVFIYKPFYQFIIASNVVAPFECSLFEKPEESPSDVDFLISIGGDGTFLESMMFLKSSTIPVIGLNSGRLGFLANIAAEEMTTALDLILKNEYEIEKRNLLRVETGIELFGGYNFALNEVTLQKIDTSLIAIEAYIGDDFINTYWADGLIIATPTGSTAYSLSVGGPIIVPGSDVLLLSPIAPHNLTMRPLVVNDDVQMKFKVKARCNSFLLSVDNRTQEIVADTGFVYVRKSKFELKMLKLPFNSYTSTIRNKLMWGVDKRN